MLKREIHTTQDGSKTIYLPEWNEHYHSKHGALQEAEHVFIVNGLNLIQNEAINILEFGFGTGLNALLTMLCSNKNIEYHSLEKYPLTTQEALKMEYPYLFATGFNERTETEIKNLFISLHDAGWEKQHIITETFSLKKIQCDFRTAALTPDFYNLVYFDAFGKRVQPELWSEEIFSEIYQSLKNKGLLTTYACNGDTKRALQKVGFKVEKKPGPPGKREMLNAWKI